MASETDDILQSDLSGQDSAQFDEEIDEDTASTTDDASFASSALSARELYNKRRPQQRQQRNKETWKYARACLPHESKVDKHGHRWFYCKHCEWRGIISNAAKHLRTHNITIKEPLTLRQIATENTISASFSKAERLAHSTASEQARNVLINAVNPESYRNAVARLITSKSLSHNLVESPEWMAMCLTLNWCARAALIKSHSSIPARIAENYHYQRGLVKQHLHKAISCIHFCTDTWYAGTSFQKEFQAINAQFVDEQGHLQQALLALPELPGGHSGAAVAPYFIDTLQWYDIEERLGWITGDNHGANDTLCRAIEEYLVNDKGITTWQAEFRRLRCIGHTINLPVQTFLFAKDDEAVAIAKERTANSTIPLDDALAELSQTDDKAGWSRAAPVYKLYRLAVALRNMRLAKDFKHLAGRILDMPNETRWNSWYRLIEEGLQSRASIVSIIDAHSELVEYQFTQDDWQLLKDTYYFLQPFNRATKLCEGHVTLDNLQDVMDMLSDHYKAQEVKHTNNESLLASINTSWHHFNEYYEALDTNPVYVTAQLLHPSKRIAHLKRKRWPAKWQREAMARAKQLWSEYKERYQPQPAANEADDECSAEPDFYELWQRRNNVAPVEDDFTAFVNAPATKLAGDSSALAWWSNPAQQAAYPALSRLAIDSLSALPMSADSERIFSRAKRTVNWQRARLGGFIIEQTECSKDWQHSGLACCPIDDHLAALEALKDDIMDMD
jgi:hypothetical protein